MRLISFGFLVVLSFALAGCHRRETRAEAGRRTGTLLLGNAAEPTDLDPQAINGEPDANVVTALFEGLTQIDEVTAKPVPGVATRWEVSPDGLTYTFHLRPEARWSNGDPVTADDFVFSYRRILAPNFAALDARYFWIIANAPAFASGKLTDFSKVGVKAIDPHTLQIRLAKPAPYLPALAGNQSWYPVPRATIEKFGPYDRKGTRWTRPGNLVGNGPFLLKEWVPNSRIVVEKNPLYWDAAHVRLNRIEFYPIESPEIEEADFRAGQLQITYGLPVARIPYYRREHPRELRIDNRLASYYLFINPNKPFLGDARVRRALSLAVDRTAIARDIELGSRTPAHSFTPPDCGGYTARAFVPDDFAEAKRLLAQAGLPGGKGLPKFEIISYANEGSIRILEAIQERWARDLGVRVTIHPMEFKTLFEEQQDHNFSIAFSAWIADFADPLTFLQMMETGDGNNSPGWSDPQYDRLMEAAANTADNLRRFEYFQKAEAILLEQAPIVPLFFGEQPYLKEPWVEGWPPARLGFNRFQNVWFAP